MKKPLFLLLALLVALPKMIFGQTDSLQLYTAYKDSVNSTFKIPDGLIKLKKVNGESLADLTVPAGFKYLDAKQSNYVIEDLWNNPKSNSSLGMLFPEKTGPLDDASWAFNIQFDEMGFVKDDDADDIDYEELLTTMQTETTEANEERKKQGYEAIQLVGWAAKPYYDKDKHILHWAKEIKFGTADVNTLNYNVRILGRKGVLVLNAIASMTELKEVNQNVNKVTSIVEFTHGNKYIDFDPELDEVAAYTIGGLVAGKVLAKVGIFALIAKFGKVIVLALVGAGSYVWKLVTGRRKEEEEKQISFPEDPNNQV